MPLKDGTLLQGGRYRIIRFLKAGGFGCTYEGYHTGLDVHVAIKEFFVDTLLGRDEETGRVTVLSEALTQQAERLEQKFYEEAKSVFRMNHPGIVHVHDVF